MTNSLSWPGGCINLNLCAGFGCSVSASLHKAMRGLALQSKGFAELELVVSCPARLGYAYKSRQPSIGAVWGPLAKATTWWQIVNVTAHSTPYGPGRLHQVEGRLQEGCLIESTAKFWQWLSGLRPLPLPMIEFRYPCDELRHKVPFLGQASLPVADLKLSWG